VVELRLRLRLAISDTQGMTADERKDPGNSQSHPRGSAGFWAICAVFGMLFSIAITPATDPDLGWHLGAGRWILKNREIPLTDPFSWSVPGRKWIAHEWLTEVLMYSVRQLGGDALLIVLWAGVITTAWVLLYRAAKASGAATGIAILVTALGAISTIHTWGARPQMLTLLLVAFTGLRLQTWRHRNGRTPWELVPLTALWANLHGGYIFGIVMVLVFACGSTAEQVLARLRHRTATFSNRRIIHLWAVTLGCVLASLATPNTIDGLIYPFTYLGDNASTRYVGEWFRPNFAKPSFWPFALFLIFLVVAAAVALRNRSLKITDLGLTVPFAFLGLQSARNISQLIVCAVPFVAANWTALTTRAASKSTKSGVTDIYARQRSVVALATGLSIVSAMVFMTRHDLTENANETARSVDYPLIATQWLKQNPGSNGAGQQANVFNHYNYGGWLILHELPVFVDGRPDMYGDAFMDEYVRLTSKGNVKNWQADMKRLGATRVLMPRISAMSKQISADIAAGTAPGWSEPTRDTTARLFVWAP
jgi:hypothetical protein